jgi:hypothetical protein
MEGYFYMSLHVVASNHYSIMLVRELETRRRRARSCVVDQQRVQEVRWKKPSSDQRGLKQGDDLAPFLFLLVVEGFSDVMRKAVDFNLFKGFAIGKDPVVISHLQYADDTLYIRKASVKNLFLEVSK